MAWKNVGRFLNRFANLKPPRKLVLEEAAKIIGGLLNTEIKASEIEERNGVLFLKKQNSALKNEVFLKKKIILEELKEKLGNKSPVDIKF